MASTYKRGEQIFSEGQKGFGVHIIQEGRVLLSKNKGNEVVEIDELKKGDYIGLPAHFINKKEDTNAIALTDVSLKPVNLNSVDKLKTNANHNLAYKLLQYFSTRLLASQEKMKKLSYFNTLHFDQYKSEELSIFHQKEILRMSWVLLLSFNKYNLSISRDYFEDLCLILMPNIKIKPDRLVDMYIKAEILTENPETKNISLIDAKKLEYFSNFMLETFLHNPKQLSLKKSNVEFLEFIVADVDNDKIFGITEIGNHFVTREALLNISSHIQGSNVILENLLMKGFFHKEYNKQGQLVLTFSAEKFKELIEFYRLLDLLQI